MATSHQSSDSFGHRLPPRHAMKVWFPKLRQANIDMLVEYSIIGVVCAVLGSIAFHFSKFAGIVLCLPLAYIYLSTGIYLPLSNWLTAFSWSRYYRRRVSPRRVAGLIQSRSGSFVLHAQFYRQISRSRLAPTCIIEDTEKHELIAVFPSAWRAVHTCREYGLQEVRYKL